MVVTADRRTENQEEIACLLCSSLPPPSRPFHFPPAVPGVQRTRVVVITLPTNDGVDLI